MSEGDGKHAEYAAVARHAAMSLAEFTASAPAVSRTGAAVAYGQPVPAGALPGAAAAIYPDPARVAPAAPAPYGAARPVRMSAFGAPVAAEAPPSVAPRYMTTPSPASAAGPSGPQARADAGRATGLAAITGAVQGDGRIRSADVCFVLDGTGSMSSWLEAAVNRVGDCVQEICTVASQVLGDMDELRMAAVVYRDFDVNEGKAETCDFVDDNGAAIGAFLRKQTAHGGGDTAEDVAGGLQAAAGLSWKAHNRVLIHIGDAPPHGSVNHGARTIDHWEDDESHGGRLPFAEAVKVLCRKGIDYYFVHCNDSTRIAAQRARHAYTEVNEGIRFGRRQNFVETEISVTAASFLQLALASVTRTLLRSARATHTSVRDAAGAQALADAAGFGSNLREA